MFDYGDMARPDNPDRPPLKHYRCKLCGLPTVSSRLETWCPVCGKGLMMEIDPLGIEVDAPLKDAYNEALANGEIIDTLMDEVYEFLGEADDV